MIEVNISELEKDGKRYLDMLTGNETEKTREEMIKFLKEAFCTDCYEYAVILEYVNDFFMTHPKHITDD